MATATPSRPAPAKPPARAPTERPRRGLRGWAAAIGTTVGVAVLLWLVYAPVYVNYDAQWALAWAHDAWHGFLPEYTADFAPTPHPLATAVSSLALPFGTHADTAMLWLTLLSFGALVYLTYRLGEVLFNRWVGLVLLFFGSSLKVSLKLPSDEVLILRSTTQDAAEAYKIGTRLPVGWNDDDQQVIDLS